MANPSSSQFPAHPRWGGAVVKVLDYTALVTDIGLWLIFNKATAITLTLPASMPDVRWVIGVVNIGVGTLTINPNGLNLDGSTATRTLATREGTVIATDGTDYFAGLPTAATGGDAGAVVKTTSYTALTGDNGKWIIFNSATQVTLTLPTPPPSLTWKIGVVNIGDGSLLIAPAGGAKINGVAASKSMIKYQAASIVTDATDWYMGIFSNETLDTLTGATYTVDDGDRGKTLLFNRATAVAVTLPQAGGGSGFEKGWVGTFVSIHDGLVTITPTTSTINGVATYALRKNQSVRLYSDGANYKVILTVKLQTGGTDNALQHLLNLIAGSNVTLDASAGDGSVVINAAAGGGATATMQTKVKTTASIADGVTETGVITAFSKVFLLYRVIADRKARVRLYSTMAARDADTSPNRPSNLPPTPGTQHGVCVDLYLDTADKLTWVLSPASPIFNREAVQVTSVSYAITNLSGATSTVQITFEYVELQA